MRSKRRGFSLLEVIVATGILAASTVMLLSLFSTGERHSDRAENRVLAQMLCQSKLDELIADPLQIRSIDSEPVDGFPAWTYTIDIDPTEIENLIRVRVSIAEAPKFDGVEKLDLGPQRPRFSLVRLLRSQPVMSQSSQQSSPPSGANESPSAANQPGGMP